jgi:ubiquinone/menaquinone biosynthesis C-methylase UbiE
MNNMSTRKEIISSFYSRVNEEDRLKKSRQGQLEYAVTMHYIHRYAAKGSDVLETGAGAGRYSIALAKEGMNVTAVELVEKNLEVLCENGRGLENLRALQGDAADLSVFADESFDMTLVLGPLHHLYEPEEISQAIDEAIRVTKKDGILFFAFLSVYGIMYANYLGGNWAFGQKENFTEDGRVRHFREQLFTGYDIEEFENLFAAKPVQHITTAGTDWVLETAERDPDFEVKEEDFEAFVQWYLSAAEKRELLGNTNHLLYICRRV